MKGPILTPILAAVLLLLIAGPIAAAVAFFVTIGVEVLVLYWRA